MTTNNGAVVYQKAIRVHFNVIQHSPIFQRFQFQTVRDSAIHRTVRSPREKPKAPALISEKAVVAADDDFIENDLLPRKSRKRKSTNSVASKSKQFISNRRYDESSEEESDGYEESESREENTVQQSFSGLLDAEEYESSGVVLLPDVEESSIQDATPTSSNSSRKSVKQYVCSKSDTHKNCVSDKIRNIRKIKRSDRFN